MTLQQRMEKVYLLITAAQALIESGHTTPARGFIQSARLISGQSDELLALNTAQVEQDIADAPAVIAVRMSSNRNE